MTASLQFIDDIVSNMKEPADVRAIALDPSNQNPDPFDTFRSSWSDLSLSNGYPSLLLLFSEFERLEMMENADKVVHTYVLKIKEVIETQGLSDLSLFGGVTGLCFALQRASFEGRRYQRVLHSLHAFLLERVDRLYFDPLKKIRHDCMPASPRFYDPIQGIAGVGRYALENLSHPSFLELAQKSAKALVTLSQPFTYRGQSTPGWFLSSTDALNVRHRLTYPKGNFNLGLAHGVTGILAFLSIALLRGVEVEGQKDAILSIATWIRSKSFGDETILWPYMVSWEEEIEKKTPSKTSSKDAWCYGVPGIARTLFLAGKAIQNEELKSFAVMAFRGVFCRKQEEWNLPGPSLCHGIAGLLLITHEMSKEEGNEDLILKVEELREILFSFYEPQASWGFKDVESCRQGRCTINKAGLLEGAVGIILTFISLSYSIPNVTENLSFRPNQSLGFGRSQLVPRISNTSDGAIVPTTKWHLPLMIHA